MNLDHLADIVQRDGPASAIDRLIADLRAAEDYRALFYALLMKSRVELGVSPFPTGLATELPPEVHERYEDAIRTAARDVGSAYLAKNDLPRAWGFYRLINEPQPVKEALATLDPGEDDDIYPLLDIAWYQRVSPERGFELLLERHGICSAITTLSGSDLSNELPLRLSCIRKLIAALHEQLQERLTSDITQRGIPMPANLFRADYGEAYHIDVSHLASVVQMSLELPPQDSALPLARDLSAYGERLNTEQTGTGESPFEDLYKDYSLFLSVLSDESAHTGLAHFEAKIAPQLSDGNTFPAEVFVNLLLRVDRQKEAIAAAKKYLANLPEEATLSCPSVVDLARRGEDYSLVAEVARAKGDAVTFLAGLIAATNKRP